MSGSCRGTFVEPCRDDRAVARIAQELTDPLERTPQQLVDLVVGHERLRADRLQLEVAHLLGPLAGVEIVRGRDVTRDPAEGAGLVAATLLFDAFLIVVVSIYMLLDMQRWSDIIDRRFPPRPGGKGRAKYLYSPRPKPCRVMTMCERKPSPS